DVGSPGVRRSFSLAARGWLATLGVVCVTVCLIAVVVTRAPVTTRPGIAAILFFLLCLAGERTFFEFETRRRDYTYLATEIPLLLALFFLAPIWLIVVRVAATAVSYGFHSPPVKVLVN